MKKKESFWEKYFEYPELARFLITAELIALLFVSCLIVRSEIKCIASKRAYENFLNGDSIKYVSPYVVAPIQIIWEE